jgi:hypothetical protein
VMQETFRNLAAVGKGDIIPYLLTNWVQTPVLQKKRGMYCFVFLQTQVQDVFVHLYWEFSTSGGVWWVSS